MTRPLFALPLAATLAVGCAAEKADGANGGELDSADAAAADSLWEAVDGYASWNQDDAWLGVQPSEDGTHGSHVQTWFNDTAADSLYGGGDTMSDGSVLVKEGYSSDSEADLSAITVMAKEDGVWLWARFLDNGEATMVGDSAADFCSGCHSVGKDSIRFIEW